MIDRLLVGARRVAILAAALLGGCAADEPPTPSADVATGARAFLDHYLATLATGDERQVRSLFCADERFAWYTDGQLSYSSPTDVVDGMRRYAGMTFDTAVADVEVVALRDELASVRASFTTELSAQGTTVHRYGGALTLLLERAQPDRWHVVLGHTSTPGGPPGADRRDASRPR